MMSFMQFQRELENRQIPKQTAFMLATVYENVFEMSKQLDTLSSLLLKTVETMQGVVGSNEVVLAQAKRLREFGKEDGIDVTSVVPDPETEN